MLEVAWAHNQEQCKTNSTRKGSSLKCKVKINKLSKLRLTPNYDWELDYPTTNRIKLTIGPLQALLKQKEWAKSDFHFQRKNKKEPPNGIKLWDQLAQIEVRNVAIPAQELNKDTSCNTITDFLRDQHRGRGAEMISHVGAEPWECTRDCVQQLPRLS